MLETDDIKEMMWVMGGFELCLLCAGLGTAMSGQSFD